MSVFLGETDDRAAGLERGGGPAGAVWVGPVVGNESSVLTQDRFRLHHEDGPAVLAEHGSKAGEDRAVVGFEARTCDLALQDRELMTQHEKTRR